MVKSKKHLVAGVKLEKHLAAGMKREWQCAACGTRLKQETIGKNVVTIVYCPTCKIWWDE